MAVKSISSSLIALCYYKLFPPKNNVRFAWVWVCMGVCALQIFIWLLTFLIKIWSLKYICLTTGTLCIFVDWSISHLKWVDLVPRAQSWNVAWTNIYTHFACLLLLPFFVDAVEWPKRNTHNTLIWAAPPAGAAASASSTCLAWFGLLGQQSDAYALMHIIWLKLSGRLIKHVILLSLASQLNFFVAPATIATTTTAETTTTTAEY